MKCFSQMLLGLIFLSYNWMYQTMRKCCNLYACKATTLARNVYSEDCFKWPKGSAKLRSMQFSHNGWTRHFSKWKPTTCFPIIMKHCFPNPPYHLFPAIVENWQSCKYQFGKSFYIFHSLTTCHDECW